MRRSLLTGFVIAVSMFALAPLAIAQPAPHITEEELLRYIQTARANGAPIREEDVATMVAIARGQQALLAEMEQEVDMSTDSRGASQSVDLTKPLSHIEGKDGVPFPKPEEVIFEPIPTSTPSAEGGATPAPVWSPKPYARPGKCEKNETKRVETHPDMPESRVFFDEIYISQDLVPLDPQEVFGMEAVLIPYGPNEERGTFLRMKIDNVPCLPYRIRNTGRAQYYDSGLNALKNYDGDPAGKGKLHQFIEQKLFPQKQAKKNK
jgi:hypothetical protein